MSLQQGRNIGFMSLKILKHGRNRNVLIEQRKFWTHMLLKFWARYRRIIIRIAATHWLLLKSLFAGEYAKVLCVWNEPSNDFYEGNGYLISWCLGYLVLYKKVKFCKS